MKSHSYVVMYNVYICMVFKIAKLKINQYILRADLPNCKSTLL